MVDTLVNDETLKATLEAADEFYVNAVGNLNRKGRIDGIRITESQVSDLQSYLLINPALGTPTSGALTNCTSIPAAQLTGEIADARLSSNVPLIDGANAFTDKNQFSKTGDSNMILNRTDAGASSTIKNSLEMVASSTGNASDGHGSRVEFQMVDDVASGVLGGVGFVRDGADAQGKFVVSSNAAHTSSLEISNNGAVDWPQGQLHTNFVMSMDGTGNLITNIANIHIKSSAAIATSKLADSANFVLKNQANTYDAGDKQTVESTTTTAGYRDIGFTADPSNPAEGDLYYNSTSNVYKYYNGSAWTAFTTGGGGGDMVLADVQTVTGAKTFLDDKLLIQNPAATFEYTIQGGAILADRALSLPAITEADTVATVNFPNTWGASNQNIQSTGSWREGGVPISPIGIHDVWVGAVGMWPTATAGCATLARTELATNDVNIQTLDFDTASDEFAQFSMPLPRNFDNTTITFEVYWTATGGSGTVSWDVAALTRSEGDDLDAAFTDETTVTDTLTTGNDLHISPSSADMTLTDHTDSDYIHFRVRRDVSDDTLGVDAKLIGIQFHITTDTARAA